MMKPGIPVFGHYGIRDYFSSSRLLPGIQYSNSGSASAVVSAVVNGTPTNTLQTRLDGATMETQPSADSIQEVAILTSNFAPEFGTAALGRRAVFQDVFRGARGLFCAPLNAKPD